MYIPTLLDIFSSFVIPISTTPTKPTYDLLLIITPIVSDILHFTILLPCSSFMWWTRSFWNLFYELSFYQFYIFTGFLSCFFNLCFITFVKINLIAQIILNCLDLIVYWMILAWVSCYKRFLLKLNCFSDTIILNALWPLISDVTCFPVFRNKIIVNCIKQDYSTVAHGINNDWRRGILQTCIICMR